jgi:hypothetical protein
MEPIIDLDESQCSQYLKLPRNAKVYRCNFQLDNLTEARKEDVILLTNIVAYVCYHIAQGDRGVKATFESTKYHFHDIILDRYVVRIDIPKDVVFTDQDLCGIHELNLELISDPIKIINGDASTQLVISVYSKANPFVMEHVSVCHMRYKTLKLVSYDTDQDDSGPVKRKRKMTPTQ